MQDRKQGKHALHRDPCHFPLWALLTRVANKAHGPLSSGIWLSIPRTTLIGKDFNALLTAMRAV
ncbi:hypothetical protein [Gluconobacter albidus]|uniref:hypothetical protein n=1 Tax=Gluconobacter albidus TaxID=318683 RepID=UPI000A7344A1|nr:hypothetical protein [Gluconobacter albidus]